MVLRGKRVKNINISAERIFLSILQLKSTYSWAEELVIDFGLTVSLHDVIALWVNGIMGRGGTHIYQSVQRGVYPIASQFRRKDKRQLSPSCRKWRLTDTKKKNLIGLMFVWGNTCYHQYRACVTFLLLLSSRETLRGRGNSHRCSSILLPWWTRALVITNICCSGIDGCTHCTKWLTL